MEHSESIVIDRPLNEVWARTGDPRAWSDWAPGLQVIEPVPASIGNGSVVRVRTSGRESEATIIDYEERRRIGIRATEKRFEFWETVELSAEGARTRVTLRMGAASRNPILWAIGVLVSPARRWLLGPPIRKDLGALRAAVEREEPASAFPG